MCIKETIPRVSITYYGPSWITTLATRFNLRMSCPPFVSLSFPRILPPDTEIFICIRTGNIDWIKDLLIEGQGSVADILASYGISTLLLAIIYRQAEVYQLLLSAGVSRVPPVNIICPRVICTNSGAIISHKIIDFLLQKLSVITYINNQILTPRLCLDWESSQCQKLPHLAASTKALSASPASL